MDFWKDIVKYRSQKYEQLNLDSKFVICSICLSIVGELVKQVFLDFKNVINILILIIHN